MAVVPLQVQETVEVTASIVQAPGDDEEDEENEEEQHDPVDMLEVDENGFRLAVADTTELEVALEDQMQQNKRRRL